MPLFINTNIASINAQRQLNASTWGIGKAMERLSSGLRINRASDDVAGLQVAETLRASSRAFGQAARNANDGISMIGVHEGSLSVVADHLVRMKELAEQSSNGTLNNTQRSALQSEFSNLQAEVDRIVDTTEFNGIRMISSAGASVTFQIGADSGAANQITFTSVNAHASALGVGTAAAAVSTQAAAQAALSSLDGAISSLASTRGSLGAVENRLQATISNIQNSIENLSASESRIRDVDVAMETANFVRLQILQQASVAMLSQANQQPSLALTLLGGR